MPRPNLAQITYGSATITLTAFVLLLLTQTQSGTGVVLIASAALVLGLLVALTAPAGRRAAARTPEHERAGAPVRRGTSNAEPRVPQPSLRQ
ncbi:hypothetical protein [Streptomyces gobiensis]|uniref:hypothetical protein n=1 Tax=Streptomyces gobiensis TaxID=2875706 RepID=UPI001E329FF6|nr:hypothetical protein [Streptomyces gobiensis]UGY91662.1 hypothetical protein test1122_07940 [Streptomyces gobiensis]